MNTKLTTGNFTTLFQTYIHYKTSISSEAYVKKLSWIVHGIVQETMELVYFKLELQYTKFTNNAIVCQH